MVTRRFSHIRYSKDKPYTLISILQIMKKGFTLSGDNEQGIVLKKSNQQIIFDIPICTKEGVLWCINMQQLDPQTGNKAAFAQVTSNITHAHTLLGHMHEIMTHKVYKHLNWSLRKGALPPCDACAIGKARQRNLENRHSKPHNIGECWYIDSMKLKKTNHSKGQFPGNDCLVLLTEHKTSHSICGWFMTKDRFILDNLPKSSIR